MAGIHPEGIHIWKRCRAIWPRIEVWLRIRSAGKINGAPVNFQKGKIAGPAPDDAVCSLVFGDDL